VTLGLRLRDARNVTRGVGLYSLFGFPMTARRELLPVMWSERVVADPRFCRRLSGSSVNPVSSIMSFSQGLLTSCGRKELNDFVC